MKAAQIQFKKNICFCVVCAVHTAVKQSDLGRGDGLTPGDVAVVGRPMIIYELVVWRGVWR